MDYKFVTYRFLYIRGSLLNQRPCQKKAPLVGATRHDATHAKIYCPDINAIIKVFDSRHLFSEPLEFVYL